MSKRNSREAKARRRAMRNVKADITHSALAGEHVDMSTAHLCRHPSGCGNRWTTEIKLPNGWATFMCDEHWEEFVPDEF